MNKKPNNIREKRSMIWMIHGNKIDVDKIIGFKGDKPNIMNG